MTVDYTAARELFLATLEQAPDDRDAFLRSRCEDNSALLAEVLSLLEFHEEEADDGSALGPLQVGERYADRYRILRRIGRGGMGDVYHAHDEVLDEPVALKRLAGRDKALHAALLNEVRLARRVTHPRICRVYDLGEWRGEHFITMEFVDGEDLGKLIRRAGRLPSERVTEMARELCVGLAAAHAKGVLHRDLKPANILVDADGHVHITDFGIAARADGRDRSMTGTPSYMAPEQLVPGGSSSERSDIYSLGLVLHEMLTGKPVYQGVGLAGVLASRRDMVPGPPSEVVADVVPELERAVLQSLRPDPRERPASALELAGLLPGGDPLLAALEANTTPSPDLVARAPAGSSLATSRSLPKLLALAGLLVVAFVLADLLALFPIGADAAHPAVSEHRAVELLGELGYDAGGDATSFHGYIQDPTAPAGETSLLFWYREDRDPNRMSFQRTVLDPAAELTLYVPVTHPKPDRLITVFDGAGELVYFQGALPEIPAGDASTAADWTRVLGVVGLGSAMLTPATPERPPVFATDWSAWESRHPGDGTITQRIDAAAANGQLVYFSRGRDEGEVRRTVDARLRSADPLIINLVLIPIFVVMAIVFLVRNIRARRIDGSGTLKLVGAVGVLSLAKWLLLADHIYHPLSDHSEVLTSSWLGVLPFFVAIVYLALEPAVRRAWPQTLMAWTRVLHRDVRNALVGQSILIGSVAGSLCAVIYVADLAIPRVVGALEPLSIDHGPRLLAVLGLRETTSLLLGNASDAISRGVILLFVFTMLRSWLGRPAISTAVFVLLVAVLESVVSLHHDFSVITMGVPIGIVTAWVLARAGLLAYVVTGFVYASIRFAPMTLDVDAWWALSGFTTASVVVLLGVFGAWMSTTSA